MPTPTGTKQTSFFDHYPPDVTYNQKRSTEHTGGVQMIQFAFTADEAIAANGTIDLCVLPHGRTRILQDLSYIWTDGLGSGRTIDIGHLAYNDAYGTAVTADPDAFADGLDVASAGKVSFGLTSVLVTPRPAIIVQATVLGNTFPVSKKLEGVIYYVHG